MHIWEYDFDISHNQIREFRKFGEMLKLSISRNMT